jgi:hypothetical protein
MSIRKAWKREARVAFSRKAQPIWFRVVKWTIVLAVSVLLWGTPHFWLWTLGGMTLGLTLHLFWRWKTRGWTQVWGGWEDLDTVDKE